MSRVLATNVTTMLSLEERKDSERRINALQTSFTAMGVLASRLAVPGAASPITVEADPTRRSLTVSMRLDAPKGRKRAASTVTWLLRQLAKTKDGSIMLDAKWPGRTPDTCAEISRIRGDADTLVGNRKGQLPHAFILRSVSDLGGKFTQRRNFVPEVVACVMRFYEAVGQHVVPWQASPPKPTRETQASAAAGVPFGNGACAAGVATQATGHVGANNGRLATNPSTGTANPTSDGRDASSLPNNAADTAPAPNPNLSNNKA